MAALRCVAGVGSARGGCIVTGSGAAVVEMNRVDESILRLEDGFLISEDRLCAGRAFRDGQNRKAQIYSHRAPNGARPRGAC
jgi:hypothetical protein